MGYNRGSNLVDIRINEKDIIDLTHHTIGVAKGFLLEVLKKVEVKSFLS